MIYHQTEHGILYHGDCLEILPTLADKSVDMILCDLPYGTTACSWDTIIPFDLLWLQYNRLLISGKCVALCGSEPFSSKLRMSNLAGFKYDWVWDKKLAGNGILAKQQPLKIHEIVSIFNSSIYYPMMSTGKLRNKMGLKESELTGGTSIAKEYKNNQYYPQSILDFSLAGLRKGREHPTQKPVPLFEYLIKTYTADNELVLDNCAGSGTTAVACVNTKRRYILIEKEEKYCEISAKRIETALDQTEIEI
jgi:DNA modification methylase